MTCSACSTRVEQCVAKLPGVAEVSVNLLKNSMAVSYDEGVLDTAAIVAAVENAGYGAIPKISARSHRRHLGADPAPATSNKSRTICGKADTRRFTLTESDIPETYTPTVRKSAKPCSKR